MTEAKMVAEVEMINKAADEAIRHARAERNQAEELSSELLWQIEKLNKWLDKKIADYDSFLKGEGWTIFNNGVNRGHLDALRSVRSYLRGECGEKTEDRLQEASRNRHQESRLRFQESQENNGGNRSRFSRRASQARTGRIEGRFSGVTKT